MDDADAMQDFDEAINQLGPDRSDKDSLRRAAAVLCRHIDADSAAGHRVIKYLFTLQTPDEQKIHDTYELNGQGFSKFDAKICSDLAEKDVRYLSEKQLLTCAAKASKYSEQARRALSHFSQPCSAQGDNDALLPSPR